MAKHLPVSVELLDAGERYVRLVRRVAGVLDFAQRGRCLVEGANPVVGPRAGAGDVVFKYAGCGTADVGRSACNDKDVAMLRLVDVGVGFDALLIGEVGVAAQGGLDSFEGGEVRGA